MNYLCSRLTSDDDIGSDGMSQIDDVIMELLWEPVLSLNLETRSRCQVLNHRFDRQLQKEPGTNKEMETFFCCSCFCCFSLVIEHTDLIEAWLLWTHFNTRLPLFSYVHSSEKRCKSYVYYQDLCATINPSSNPSSSSPSPHHVT